MNYGAALSFHLVALFAALAVGAYARCRLIARAATRRPENQWAMPHERVVADRFTGDPYAATEAALAAQREGGTA